MSPRQIIKNTKNKSKSSAGKNAMSQTERVKGLIEEYFKERRPRGSQDSVSIGNNSYDFYKFNAGKKKRNYSDYDSDDDYEVSSGY